MPLHDAQQVQVQPPSRGAPQLVPQEDRREPASREGARHREAGAHRREAVARRREPASLVGAQPHPGHSSDEHTPDRYVEPDGEVGPAVRPRSRSRRGELDGGRKALGGRVKSARRGSHLRGGDDLIQFRRGDGSHLHRG